MAHANLNTHQKLTTCLNYLDTNIESQSTQTTEVAETIINDIKNLTLSYQNAMARSQLVEHAELVHHTQMNWVSQLQQVVTEQKELSLNGQVIQALHKFAKNLNKNNQTKIAVQQTELNLPSGMEEPIQAAQANLTKEQVTAYISQSSSALSEVRH